jgi:hypothetical protein
MVMNEKKPPSTGAVDDGNINRTGKTDEFGNDQRRDQNAGNRTPIDSTSLIDSRIGVGHGIVAHGCVHSHPTLERSLRAAAIALGEQQRGADRKCDSTGG